VVSTQRFECARRDVIALGFEACCVTADGTRYLWHADAGLRSTPDGHVTLFTDAALLPDGPWVLTELGERELHEGELWM